MTTPRLERIKDAHPDIDIEDARNLLVMAYLNANQLNLNVQQHLEETTDKLIAMKPHALKTLITSIQKWMILPTTSSLTRITSTAGDFLATRYSALKKKLMRIVKAIADAA